MNMGKLDFILDRRSIRRFSDQKIDSKQIKAMLTAAMYAPSAVNMQPWAIPRSKNPDRTAFIVKK